MKPRSTQYLVLLLILIIGVGSVVTVSWLDGQPYKDMQTLNVTSQWSGTWNYAYPVIVDYSFMVISGENTSVTIEITNSRRSGIDPIRWYESVTLSLNQSWIRSINSSYSSIRRADLLILDFSLNTNQSIVLEINVSGRTATLGERLFELFYPPFIIQSILIPGFILLLGRVILTIFSLQGQTDNLHFSKPKFLGGWILMYSMIVGYKFHIWEPEKWGNKTVWNNLVFMPVVIGLIAIGSLLLYWGGNRTLNHERVEDK